MTQSLVLFDLDHTLLTCDSDVEWSRYLHDKGYVGQDAVVKRDKYSKDYHQGTLNLDEFLQFQLEFLGKNSIQQLRTMHQEFMSEYIIPNISSQAYELVDKHIKHKDQVILVSATNEFIITPIARHFNIQEVIGVSLVVDERGNYTGQYQGIPSYREGKVTRVEGWLTEHDKQWQDYEASYFYSDSFNDLSLLCKVSHPVAVNPDDKLRQYAEKHNWQILSIKL